MLEGCRVYKQQDTNQLHQEAICELCDAQYSYLNLHSPISSHRPVCALSVCCLHNPAALQHVTYPKCPVCASRAFEDYLKGVQSQKSDVQ